MRDNNDKLTLLLALMCSRKDRRYRAGLLQAFVSLGVITHEEWSGYCRKWVYDKRPARAGRKGKGK